MHVCFFISISTFIILIERSILLDAEVTATISQVPVTRHNHSKSHSTRSNLRGHINLCRRLVPDMSSIELCKSNISGFDFKSLHTLSPSSISTYVIQSPFLIQRIHSGILIPLLYQEHRIIWIQIEVIWFGVPAVVFDRTLDFLKYKMENVTPTKLSSLGCRED